jgi:YMGG-like Gly-zipper
MKTKSRSKLTFRAAGAVLATSVLATIPIHAQTPAPAAKPLVYPSKGQNPQQQEKDTNECYAWSTKQTGYDPVVALQEQQAAAAKSQQETQAAQQNANSGGGERARGAARGAVGGAAIGAIAGDTGKGAAIGAVAGTMAGGARKRGKQREAQAQQQQVQDAQAQQQAAADQKFADYQKGWSVCMEGRGYTVK